MVVPVLVPLLALLALRRQHAPTAPTWPAPSVKRFRSCRTDSLRRYARRSMPCWEPAVLLALVFRNAALAVLLARVFGNALAARPTSLLTNALAAA